MFDAFVLFDDELFAITQMIHQLTYDSDQKDMI